MVENGYYVGGEGVTRVQPRLARPIARNIEMLQNAPKDLARLLRVPVAHASCVGVFSAASLSSPEDQTNQCFLGQSQIVAGDGSPIGGTVPETSETVLVRELPTGTHGATTSVNTPQIWIPQLTEAHLRVWSRDAELGKEFYNTVAVNRYKDESGGGTPPE